MKKFFMLIMALFTFAMMNVPFAGTAEAAYVAVVPIDIDVDKVERAADFNGYYWDIIIDRFQYPEYELMDDEKVNAVLPEDGLKSFDKATLVNVAAKVPSEVVVAMRISEVKEEPMSFRREPLVRCIMKGELAIYNRLTDNYYYKKIHYNEQMEEVLTLRTDWQQQAFAGFLRRGINRAMEYKNTKKLK